MIFANVLIHVVVGGCIFTDPEDPGNLQFDWLEVQLKMYRNRNMQVCGPVMPINVSEIDAHDKLGVLIRYFTLPLDLLTDLTWNFS